jgi:predicted permease
MKLKHELYQSVIGLKKDTGFTFVFIFTLTLTLSALIAAFNLNNVLLLKPLPYPNAEQLHLLTQKILKNGNEQSGSQIIDAQIGAYNQGKDLATTAITYKDKGLLLSHASRPSLLALYTSHEWFDLLSVPMYLGHGFSPSSDLNDTRNEAVLSYKAWQTYFPGEQTLSGQTIQFDDVFYTVIGVIEPNFVEPAPFFNEYAANDIYLPFSKGEAYISSQEGDGDIQTSHLLSLIKVDNQSSALGLQQQFSQLFSEIVSAHPELSKGDLIVNGSLTDLTSAVKGDSYQITLLIFAGAAALLFIAMVNIINLYFSHVAKKQQMLAICASVGAKPRDIFKKLFVENAVLTLSSTFYALLLAAGILELSKEFAATKLPRMNVLGLDTITVLFSIAVAFLLTVILSWLGSRLINHNTLKEQLTSSGKGTSIQVTKRTRDLLTISQTLLTGLLLLGASLVVSSTLKLINKPLGFDANNVINFNIQAGEKYQSADKINLMLSLKQQLALLPQVEEASVSLVSPLNVGNYRMDIFDENQQMVGNFGINSIDEHYFSVLQQALINGRSFSSQEIMDRTKVVVVSETLAKTLFGHTDVIDEVIYSSTGKASKIIGVVSDHFNGSNEEKFNNAYLYLPWSNYFRDITIKLKEHARLDKVEVLRQIHQLDSSINILDYQALSWAVEHNLSSYKIASWLAIGLSLFALVLAGSGIYGVMHYSTQMRRYELGVRMALGAKQQRMISLVVKEAFKPLLWGFACSVILGTLLYLMLNNHIQQLGTPNLFQVSAAMLILMILSLVACVMPVRKIVSEDPTKALRNE